MELYVRISTYKKPIREHNLIMIFKLKCINNLHKTVGIMEAHLGNN